MAQVGLRRSARKSKKSIFAAIWIALILHASAWLYWKPTNKISVAELPDWVNITLVAGIEDNPGIKNPEPQPVSIQKPKPAIDNTAEQQEAVSIPVAESAVDEKTQPVEREQKKATSTNTFVQADSRPFILDNPRPVYPSSARRRGMQGVVLLQVSVSDKGDVTAIHILRSSGFRILDVAALKSVKRWRFMPARQGERDVASSVQVPIRFILNNS